MALKADALRMRYQYTVLIYMVQNRAVSLKLPVFFCSLQLEVVLCPHVWLQSNGDHYVFFQVFQVTTNRHCRHPKQDVAAKQGPPESKNEFSPSLSETRGTGEAAECQDVCL